MKGCLYTIVLPVALVAGITIGAMLLFYIVTMKP